MNQEVKEEVETQEGEQNSQKKTNQYIEYLSVFEESEHNLSKSDEVVEQKSSFILVIFQLIMLFIVNIFFAQLFAILSNIILYYKNITESNANFCEKVCMTIFTLILFAFVFTLPCGVIYIQISGIIQIIEMNSIFKYLYFDINYFYITSILVITYIQVCKRRIQRFSDIFKFDYFLGKEIRNTITIPVIFLIHQLFPLKVFKTDKDNDCDDKGLQLFAFYNFTDNSLLDQQEIIQRQFQYFDLQTNPNILSKNTLKIKLKNLDVSIGNLFILISLVFLKLVFLFKYLTFKNGDLNLNTFDIIFTIMVYVFSISMLNLVLSNSDLKSKTNNMQYLNSMIDFSKISKDEIQEKLDITDSTSLETWDTTRKYALCANLEFLQEIEYSYLCLLIYFIFLFIVLVTEFGEFYWIISKDSMLLDPQIIIVSTFNFIFLSLFFFFRIWEGQKLNDTFGNQEESIDQIIDTTKDLITMFDVYFNPIQYTQKHQFQNSDEEQAVDIKVKKYSIQGLIIRKVKLLSQNYIQKQIQFLGKVYNEDSKQILRRKILKNMAESLTKVKQSINNDSKIYSYKFLNLFEVSFFETLLTNILAAASFAPIIIPKFISYYQPQQYQQ